MKICVLNRKLEFTSDFCIKLPKDADVTNVILIADQPWAVVIADIELPEEEREFFCYKDGDELFEGDQDYISTVILYDKTPYHFFQDSPARQLNGGCLEIVKKP